jgi:hypothetical protein
MSGQISNVPRADWVALREKDLAKLFQLRLVLLIKFSSRLPDTADKQESKVADMQPQVPQSLLSNTPRHRSGYHVVRVVDCQD